MWDVKKIVVLPFSTVLICFTLTMWDVKLSYLPQALFQENQFYLNYVGCKAAKLLTPLNGTSCFTLTMWDVKAGFSSFLALP